MPLLTKIATALGCARDEVTAVTTHFRGYVIHDLPRRPAPPPRTILLLESPHKDERAAGHPLAGPEEKQAGRIVTDALRLDDEIRMELDGLEGANQNPTIGRILLDRPETLRLGVMNASLLPLQITAHSPENWERYGEFLCFLQLVKARPSLLLNRARLQAPHRAARIYKVLLGNLKSRLRVLPHGALVVPCGDVARVFEMAARPPRRRYQVYKEVYPREKIPHPSARSIAWRDHQHVRALVGRIRERAAGN